MRGQFPQQDNLGNWGKSSGYPASPWPLNIPSLQNQCVNNCFGKFTNVNQKILGVYIDVQQEINTRRIAELEANQASAIQETAPTAPAVTETATNA